MPKKKTIKTLSLEISKLRKRVNELVYVCENAQRYADVSNDMWDNLRTFREVAIFHKHDKEGRVLLP